MNPANNHETSLDARLAEAALGCPKFLRARALTRNELLLILDQRMFLKDTRELSERPPKKVASLFRRNLEGLLEDNQETSKIDPANSIRIPLDKRLEDAAKDCPGILRVRPLTQRELLLILNMKLFMQDIQEPSERSLKRAASFFRLNLKMLLKDIEKTSKDP